MDRQQNLFIENPDIVLDPLVEQFLSDVREDLRRPALIELWFRVVFRPFACSLRESERGRLLAMCLQELRD